MLGSNLFFALLSLSDQVLELCMRLNVKCVSIYTFSIENFSRPASEVDALMDLARGRFRELASKGCVLSLSCCLLNSA